MLHSRIRMPDWSEEHGDGGAKCRKLPRPRPGQDPYFEERAEAKAFCNGDFDGAVCPRRDQCLFLAMINFEAFGVWGGMTEAQRRVLRVAFPTQPYRWTHESLEGLDYVDE
jgi:hypothetical protein